MYYGLYLNDKFIAYSDSKFLLKQAKKKRGGKYKIIKLKNILLDTNNEKIKNKELEHYPILDAYLTKEEYDMCFLMAYKVAGDILVDMENLIHEIKKIKFKKKEKIILSDYLNLYFYMKEDLEFGDEMTMLIYDYINMDIIIDKVINNY